MSKATAKKFESVSVADFILAKFQEVKESRIETHPTHVNRASEIGHPCDRFLYHRRVDFEDLKTHTWEQQCAFDEGYIHEKEVFKELISMDAEVIKQQMDKVDEDLKLSGHVDGIIVVNDIEYLLEIKSINPFTWQSLKDYDSIRHSETFWITRYAYQFQAYLYLTDTPQGIIIFKNKSSGQWKVIDIPRDQPIIEDIKERCKRINECVEKKIAPDPIPWNQDVCPGCPARGTLCQGEKIEVGDDDVIHDEELEAMIDEILVMREAKSGYDKLYKTVKAKVEGIERARCGKYLITGSWVEVAPDPNPKPRNGYRYWRPAFTDKS